MEPYSVLMSVYHKADPAFFDAALKSMVEQTIMSNDIVIVCDGPLTPELDAVLEKYCIQYPGVFNPVHLETNVGIGAAANIGLRYCKNELIAKMDSDDIAIPTRCEKQLERFVQCPELTVLGGHIAEFDTDPQNPISIRAVPIENKAIRQFARRRQPFNNMTVMYRRNAVLAVGGYRKLKRGEDFDLFIRLIASNYYCENLDSILVHARTDKDALSRRGAMDSLKGCIKSRWTAHKLGCASLLDFCMCVCGELVIMISPLWLKKYLYSRFLRKSASTKNAAHISTGKIKPQ